MSDRLQERSWNAGSSFAGRDEACFTPTCLTKPEKQAMKQLLLVILLLSGVSAIKEGCRQVEVEETRVCHEREVEECGVCATIFQNSIEAGFPEVGYPAQQGPHDC